MMTNIILSGSGKMGEEIKKAVDESEDFCLLGKVEDDIKEKGCIVDFSHKDKLSFLIRRAKELNCPILTGTTGFSETDLSLLRKEAEERPVLLSYNMSQGINLILSFLKERREAINKAYDVSILEIHHRDKKDSPSGTALLLKDALGRGDISSYRWGKIKGTHEICLFNDEELIEIKHTALDRKCFAKGALKGAEFLMGKRNGFYTMEDVFFG